MEFLLASYIFELGLLAAALAVLYRLYSPFKHWEKKGIPYIKPNIPILGNIEIITGNISDVSLKWYHSFPESKFVGNFLLWRPQLVVKDPQLIESILIKDFSSFYNRDNVVDINTNELSKHLVNYHDENWKALRNKLTPTFTSGKLKGMHPQIVKCADAFVKYVSSLDKDEIVNVKDLAGRFSMDVVASVAFGLDLDVMNNPDNKFYQIGKDTFAANYFVKIFFLLQSFLAPIYRIFGLGLIPKSLTKFFVDALEQTVAYREKNDVKRSDYLDLLIELKKKDDEQVKNKLLNPNDPVTFDRNSLVSNAFVFFAAGYETTSAAIANTLYELALNPDVQEKLYNDVIEVYKKHNGFPFDVVHDMPYLEQVVSETLRLHPPGVALDRQASKDYTFPGTDLTIEKGTVVMIPILGIHYDPHYWPEPEKFKPERFDQEKNSIVKGTYLPFGAGPRICIASRFAKIEVKTCLVTLLRHFKVKRCSKTVVPMQYDQRSFLLSVKDGVHLTFEKRIAPVA